jgi:V-type H+-transporting ATPase S1 subunit
VKKVKCNFFFIIKQKYSEPLKRKAREAAEEKEEKTEEKPAPVAAPKQPVKARDSHDEEPAPYVLFSNPNVLLAIREFWVNGADVLTGAPSYTVTFPTEDKMTMTVTLTSGTHNLEMTVVNATGRWETTEFKYNNEIYHPKESSVYGFSAGWSFGCRNLTLEAPAPAPYTGDRKIIRLVRFQFQPSWDPRETNEFGPCNDCIGFFSAGIWGGLFVVILLMLILFWGICNMLDIRTMDRFDDPKGKTIIVSAQE